MNYQGCVQGAQTELSVQREGLRLGKRFLDFADVAALRPVNHRVLIDTLAGEQLEVSMLGFSYDGFWEELTASFGERSVEALFVEEELLMRCEGEYAVPGERGRGLVALYSDAVCILPPSAAAVRVPLCFAERIALDGYQLTITLRSGAAYTVGKMGYDTQPFAERTRRQADLTKKRRAAALSSASLRAPFTEKGLFRTEQPGQSWMAAFGPGVCALELLAGEDAATYLYRFREPQEVFLSQLEAATEAMGIHREIIYLPEDQIAEKPLYRMAAARSEAVRYLRARSDGRLIHSANHAQRLAEYLQG